VEVGVEYLTLMKHGVFRGLRFFDFDYHVRIVKKFLFVLHYAAPGIGVLFIGKSGFPAGVVGDPSESRKIVSAAGL